MRLFRQQDPSSDLDLDRDRDEDLDLDFQHMRPELVPGRRPLMRSARPGAMRGDARAAVRRAGAASGQPLSAAVRAKLERALGVDLSGVRVHDDSAAAAAAESIAANAFTIGQDIYFAAGMLDPSTQAGYRLLAHEVTHTVQQGASPQSLDGLAVSEPGDALEIEAERIADAVAMEPDAGEVTAVADAIRPRDRAGVTVPATDRVDASHAATRAAAPTPAIAQASSEGPIAQRDGNGGDAAAPAAAGAAATITWTTPAAAPGGGANRFTLGPGETVNFTSSASGTWTASGGDPATGPDSTTFTWKAPTTTGMFTIKCTADGKDAQQGMSVLAPTTIQFTNVGPSGSFGEDQAGVGMELDMKVGADNASFGNIQIKEQPGGAASATGVFAKMPNNHVPNADWTNIRDNNVSGSYDEAFAGPFDQPVEMGSMNWNIPYLWQPRDGSGGGSFAIVNQVMSVVDSKGTMTITKGSASATRTPKPKAKPAAGADGKAAGGDGAAPAAGQPAGAPAPAGDAPAPAGDAPPQ